MLPYARKARRRRKNQNAAATSGAPMRENVAGSGVRKLAAPPRRIRLGRRILRDRRMGNHRQRPTLEIPVVECIRGEQPIEHPMRAVTHTNRFNVFPPFV